MVRLSKSHNKAIDVIQKTIGERLAKTAHMQMHENLHTQIWFPVSFVRNKWTKKNVYCSPINQINICNTSDLTFFPIHKDVLNML